MYINCTNQGHTQDWPKGGGGVLISNVSISRGSLPEPRGKTSNFSISRGQSPQPRGCLSPLGPLATPLQISVDKKIQNKKMMTKRDFQEVQKYHVHSRYGQKNKKGHIVM